MTVTIFTRAIVPQELQQKWLQHLRDFDVANPGCHFEVMIDAPDASFVEVMESMRVEPELTLTEYFRRKR